MEPTTTTTNPVTTFVNMGDIVEAVNSSPKCLKFDEMLKPSQDIRSYFEGFNADISDIGDNALSPSSNLELLDEVFSSKSERRKSFQVTENCNTLDYTISNCLNVVQDVSNKAVNQGLDTICINQNDDHGNNAQVVRTSISAEYQQVIKGLTDEILSLQKIISVLNYDLNAKHDDSKKESADICELSSNGLILLELALQKLDNFKKDMSNIITELYSLIEVVRSKSKLGYREKLAIKDRNITGTKLTWSQQINKSESRLLPSQKRVVKIYADSHGRGLSELMMNMIPLHYTIQGIVKPNAPTSEICHTIKYDRSIKDGNCIIIMTGTNDFDSASSQDIIQVLEDILCHLKTQNVILVDIPHRHDLKFKGHTNLKIFDANKKIEDLSSKYKCHLVKIGRGNLHRNGHTKHGLHFSRFGKNELARKLFAAIKLCMSNLPSNSDNLQTASSVHHGLAKKQVPTYNRLTTSTTAADTSTQSARNETPPINRITDPQLVASVEVLSKRYCAPTFLDKWLTKNKSTDFLE